MNISKDIKDFGGVILTLISIIVIMIIMYSFGYNQSRIDISNRMYQYDEQGEECYTREEVDSFIFGEYE